MHKQALAGFLGILLGFWPAFNFASTGIKPVSIQLKFFMLPVIDKRGNRKTEAITIFLHVREKGHVKVVCRVVPRLRDAIVQVLYANPLHVIGNSIQANGTRQRVVDQLNYSLGKNMVIGFKLFRGVKSFGRGMSGRLPGAKLGCVRVGNGMAKLEFIK